MEAQPAGGAQFAHLRRDSATGRLAGEVQRAPVNVVLSQASLGGVAEADSGRVFPRSWLRR